MNIEIFRKAYIQKKEKLGLTNDEIGKTYSVSQSILSRFCNGKGGLSFQNAVNLWPFVFGRSLWEGEEMERVDCFHKIVCSLKVDFNRDFGQAKQEGESQKEFVSRLIKKMDKPMDIRPCPLVHMWVEKWWCIYRCQYFKSATDIETGEVLLPDTVQGREVKMVAAK